MRDRAKSSFNEVVESGTKNIVRSNDKVVVFDRATGVTTVTRTVFRRFNVVAEGDSYGVIVRHNNNVIAELPFEVSVDRTFIRWIKTATVESLFEACGNGLVLTKAQEELASKLSSAWRTFI
jgi:hypothetical protein